MIPAKESPSNIAISRSSGGEEQPLDRHELRSTKERINSLHQPIEQHWQLPQIEKKRSSFSRLSFKSVMSFPLKFRESFKRTGKGKNLLLIYEGPHYPKDEQMVKSLYDLLESEGQLPGEHNDYHTILRFLRMRAFDLLKAKDMYLKMVKWRNDFGVDAIAKEFKFEEYGEVKKYYPHGFHGVDRYGRPLYIERIGMIDLNALLQVTTTERFLKYHISEQEKTMNLRYPACSVAVKTHIASTISILDVKGVGMNNFTKPARDIFMEIQKVDSNYYPETLHQLYIVNAGSGFRVLWKALKAFVETRTLGKIQVLGSNYQSKLIEVIDPSNLPCFLGGNCTCSEYGGCLMSDKGPWNDPEIKELLQAICDPELKYGNKTNDSMAFEETLGDYQIIDAYDTHTRELEPCIETENVDEIVSQKILSLEAAIKDLKMTLIGLLTKQEKLVKQIEELKKLALMVLCKAVSMPNLYTFGVESQLQIRIISSLNGGIPHQYLPSA